MTRPIPTVLMFCGKRLSECTNEELAFAAEVTSAKTMGAFDMDGRPLFGEEAEAFYNRIAKEVLDEMQRRSPPAVWPL